MNKKILSREESKKIFEECIKFPLFILELNEYEKQKVLEIAFEEFRKLQEKTFYYLADTSNDSVLSDLEKTKKNLNKLVPEIPKENELSYFLTHVSEIGIRLHVLFKNLGYEMGLNSWGLMPIDDPEKERKEIDLNPSIIQNVFNCLKDYFHKEEHHNLNLILLGNSIDKRLNFKSNQNVLADVFFQLHEQKLIFVSKEATVYWLSNISLTTIMENK